MRAALWVAVLLCSLVACDNKPKHYLVLCDPQDGNGWRLSGFEKDDNGYLMACTYTKPDFSDFYTRRCTDAGCN